MDALTKFAPAYFEYTRKAFQGQRPTVLAKIYGFFKIGYRNAITGRSMRMNVLIMENLFYERRFSKIYDLKGSTRNRLIQATGRINEVLLDENLMESESLDTLKVFTTQDRLSCLQTPTLPPRAFQTYPANRTFQR
jgi:1-phosphatidylinositol-3-phosphate 5-kinase